MIAFLAFFSLFSLFVLVMAGLTLAVTGLWLDIKDQLQERRRRRQAR